MLHSKVSEEKILEIIQKVESDKDVEIMDCILNHGAEKGDSFNSIVFACDFKANLSSKVKVSRVNTDSKVDVNPDIGVNSCMKEYHWIIKMPCESNNPIRPLRMEEKEIMMYQKIIPSFKRFIQERKADICFNFCDLPYAEFHEEEEKGSILVLENLKCLGYRYAADMKRGLNIHYAKVALTEIAKFHAVGYAYMKSYPGGLEEGLRANSLMVRDYFYCNAEKFVKDHRASSKPMFIDSITALLQAVQEPGQDFVKSFLTFHKERDYLEYRDMLLQPKDEQFNTFCHGDLWFSNIFFYHDKSEEGVEIPTKAAFVDLTTTRWTSPCTDLAFFMFMSVSPQLRKTHLLELLGHYHDMLTRCLHRLGEDPTVYPYRQLLKDYDRHRYIGLISSLCLLPAFICKQEDMVGPEDFKGKDRYTVMFESMRKTFKDNDHLKSIIAGNFLELVDSGLLNL